MDIYLLGIPLQDGSRRLGCEMGPGAYRAAGIVETLSELGHVVEDLGNIVSQTRSQTISQIGHTNQSLYKLAQMCDWVDIITQHAYQARRRGFPVFMGGDHAMSAGTVAGIAKYADEIKRPLFVLWLDAHTDFHTLDTTKSGNIHGTPVAYFTGHDQFSPPFPPLPVAVRAENICFMGIRSVDVGERNMLKKTPATLYDMRAIDESGVSVLLQRFLQRVEAANGVLHVSLDVDFLDPSIAPAVGTTVSGGATFREAHLIMEMLCDSGLCISLDLAELNPFLDERGKTAILMMDLAASLFGRRVIDRINQSY